MKVLSLGAGVQSSTILLMACRGEIEKPEVAIFADTGWEDPRTYEHLKFLVAEASSANIPVLVVSNGNVRDDLLNAAEMKSRFYQIPLFMQRGGKLSMGRRHCTEHYKLRSIHKKIRELLDVGPRARIPQDAVELWVGISLDEYQRMAPSRAKFDNNILALPDHFEKICGQVAAEGLTVDFNQGLDIRLLTPRAIEVLKTVRLRELRFAYDDASLAGVVEEKVALIREAGLMKHPFFYVLVGFNSTFEEALARLEHLRRLECRPYVMRYGDAARKPEYITLARWANLHWAFAKYDFQDFAAHFGPGKARH